ncbi:hypothetical protein ACKOUJ_10435 [Legionella pneumophila]|nr:hypothetical protein [Legionella pneumophila]
MKTWLNKSLLILWIGSGYYLTALVNSTESFIRDFTAQCGAVFTA